jgi:hypothetical protein
LNSDRCSAMHHGGRQLSCYLHGRCHAGWLIE